MKKILAFTLLSIIFSSTAFAYAEEEVILQTAFIPNLIAKAEQGKNTYPILENVQIEDPVIKSGILETNTNSTSNPFPLWRGLSQTAQNIYNLKIENTNVPSCLLKDQLTHTFEEGALENIHVWGVLQTNMTATFPQYEDTDTNFNVGLINVLVDGKFRGGKENFRIMFDPTHQHNHGFMQQFIQDLYVESHRIPHHTVLVGNSRPGVGYEGAQSPYTLPLANRSQISRNLANARKFGVRIKGDYSYIDYDLGGYSSDTFFTEFMPGAEFDGWINFKPLAGTNGKYGKLVTGGGIVSGSRNSTDFFTSGAYVGYEYKNLWIRAEYANANGSNGGGGLTKRKQQGWYVTLGYKINKKLEAILRYDEFDANKKISNNNSREYTAGLNYYIKGQALKIILNYVYCQNEHKADSHRIILGTQLAI